MDSLNSYLVASLVALALAAVVVGVLFRPLFGVVKELCGTRESALFWSVYLSTLLMLSPLLGVAFIATVGPHALDLAVVLERSVFFALLALTVALVTIGVGIWRPGSRLAVPVPPASSAAGETAAM